MRSTHTPERWMVFSVGNHEKTVYKLLAGWQDLAILTTNIVRAVEYPKYYEFYTQPGMGYRCLHNTLGLTSRSAGRLLRWRGEAELLQFRVNAADPRMLLLDPLQLTLDFTRST